ncbi:hypothetical protein GOD95_09895 [Paeniclostridium sordellii]|uniref:hypothetical protein n=1 Tax=Paraclostridium sordellii TaxID=1505 RepID=UPI0012EE668A|nr:hypothetical protein [Paeniclostridium sordellii]MVO71751.1 hypothetical protein [Paeniclostridium sordellii]
MVNKRERKNMYIFSFILIAFSIFYYVLLFRHKINLSSLVNSKDGSIHFNLITVNSIFAGFLFSSLSLIVGINNIKIINFLDKAGYIKNIYVNIILGIIFSFISITAALTSMFANDIFQEIKIISSFVIPSIELLALLLAMITFVKAVIDISFIIKRIRNDAINKNSKQDDIDETLKRIK